MDMIYTFKELLRKGETQYSVRQKLRNGSLFQFGRGLYSDKPNGRGSEAHYCKMYPNGILTGYTAFTWYDLTDGVPEKISLATPRNALPIRDVIVEQSYQALDTIAIGATTVETEDGPVRIYDLERTAIELFRRRSKFPSDLYYEVLSSLRERKGELDFVKIYDYLSAFKNGSGLFQKIKEAMA